MDYTDYTFRAEYMSFKHHITEKPPCDAFSMHTHNMYELLYFISGDATHIIEDRKYKLKKGDLILIRPSKYHFIQIDSSVTYERYDILFDEKALGITEASRVSRGIEVVNLTSNAIADALLKKSDYYCANLPPSEFVQVMTLILRELFINLSIKREYVPSDHSLVSPLLSKALKYINDNIFTVTSVSEVASALFVTESYLYRLFKTELKNSPKKYIADKRLLYAQKLILGGKKPTEVYEDCGFNDYTSFYRGYLKFFGHTPSKDHK